MAQYQPKKKSIGDLPTCNYQPKKKSVGDLPTCNFTARHANTLLNTPIALLDTQLYDDYMKVLQGHCIYIPNFFSTTQDYSLLSDLTCDLEKHSHTGMVNWSKHLKHENPDFSPTFNQIITKMANYFDVEVYATRLNFYCDGSDWKPFHHDSHAYVGSGIREDFTMGASFGASRQLVFLHPSSGQTFSFPQNNGDVFAFTAEANKRFQHGVPKISNQMVGPRFSIIAWGIRRSITVRNSAIGERSDTQIEKGDIVQKLEQHEIIIKSEESPTIDEITTSKAENEETAGMVNDLSRVIEVAQVSEMVQRFIENQQNKQKAKAQQQQITTKNNNPKEVKKSRVQGGWAGKSKHPIK